MIVCVWYRFLFSCFFFFKQKTAYEMRISDWSSDVCSSDLFDLGISIFMDSEEWRPVLGYEGYYEVSSLGRVRSLPRIRSAKRRKGTQFTMRMAGRVLVLCLNKSGYLAGNMCIEGQRKNFEVHRLVCKAFHGPAPDGQQAAHKDGVRTNCYASNLRWATPASNTADKYGHGTILRGARHPRAKLTPDGVRHIRSSGRSSRVMAEEFGVSLSVIKAVRSGQSWKSVI